MDGAMNMAMIASGVESSAGAGSSSAGASSSGWDRVGLTPSTNTNSAHPGQHRIVGTSRAGIVRGGSCKPCHEKRKQCDGLRPICGRCEQASVDMKAHWGPCVYSEPDRSTIQMIYDHSNAGTMVRPPLPTSHSIGPGPTTYAAYGNADARAPTPVQVQAWQNTHRAAQEASHPQSAPRNHANNSITPSSIMLSHQPPPMSGYPLPQQHQQYSAQLAFDFSQLPFHIQDGSTGSYAGVIDGGPSASGLHPANTAFTANAPPLIHHHQPPQQDLLHQVLDPLSALRSHQTIPPWTRPFALSRSPSTPEIHLGRESAALENNQPGVPAPAHAVPRAPPPGPPGDTLGLFNVSSSGHGLHEDLAAANIPLPLSPRLLALRCGDGMGHPPLLPAAHADQVPASSSSELHQSHETVPSAQSLGSLHSVPNLDILGQLHPLLPGPIPILSETLPIGPIISALHPSGGTTSQERQLSVASVVMNEYLSPYLRRDRAIDLVGSWGPEETRDGWMSDAERISYERIQQEVVEELERRASETRVLQEEWRQELMAQQSQGHIRPAQMHPSPPRLLRLTSDSSELTLPGPTATDEEVATALRELLPQGKPIELLERTLLDIFFQRRSQFAHEFDIANFLDRRDQPFQSRRRHHSSYRNAMLLVACMFWHGLSEVRRRLEIVFLEGARLETDSSLGAFDRLVDTLGAYTLLGLHHYERGHLLQGYLTFGSAANLARVAGLDRIGTHVFRDPQPAMDSVQRAVTGLQGSFRVANPLLAPPSSARELGNRILAFWSLWIMDASGTAVHSLSRLIDDTAIMTPLPLPPAAYEDGSAMSLRPLTLRDFWDGQGVLDLTRFTPFALHVLATALVDAAADSARLPDAIRLGQISLDDQILVPRSPLGTPAFEERQELVDWDRARIDPRMVHVYSLTYCAMIYLYHIKCKIDEGARQRLRSIVRAMMRLIRAIEPFDFSRLDLINTHAFVITGNAIRSQIADLREAGLSFTSEMEDLRTVRGALQRLAHVYRYARAAVSQLEANIREDGLEL
ncbi:hypothetical protein DL93DRAFT_1731466 [Clavulina sp. PMI_390]|nr:hypothetical protein DL93DRAFT_1731466 [Clavulina sp. PMI_390]